MRAIDFDRMFYVPAENVIMLCPGPRVNPSGHYLDVGWYYWLNSSLVGWYVTGPYETKPEAFREGETIIRVNPTVS